ncbi:MAG: hypothetical protein K2N87_01895 [Eubacterium sp.]|nr:hypothetical protein [Eubacterium sp.]
MLCPIFGLIRLFWERRLIVSRKTFTGTDGFSATVIGTLAGIAGLWQMTDNYIYAAVYVAAVIAAYILICVFVPKKEYPPEERFTKEW